MGIMVSEVHEALVDAGASEAKAKAAAEVIPVIEPVATKTEIAALEAKVWRAGVAIAALAVLLNKCLDWVIR